MLRKKLSVVGIVMGGGSLLVSWFVKASERCYLSKAKGSNFKF